MFRLALFVLAVAGLAGPVPADDAYYYLPLDKVELTEGSLPKDADTPDAIYYWQRRDVMQAYVALDGPGEAYVRYQTPAPWDRGSAEADREHLAVRAPEGRDVTGRLYLPSRDLSAFAIVKFRIPASAADKNAQRSFLQLKAEHYEQLVSRDIPGGAWFRYQLRQTQKALGKPTTEEGDAPRPAAPTWNRFDNVDTTFELFTGGRAVSENLQLDRGLLPGRADQETVPVDSIEGITVREIDWKPLIEGKKPGLDPLAAKVPFDQHVVFFPTFRAALAMSDETKEVGDLVFQMAQPRSTDAQVFPRYQKQLCLTISGLARLLGPHVAQSVVLTGSDPYFPTGTDVAVLFETPNPAMLQQLVLAQVSMKAQAHKDAKPANGEVAGVQYQGFRSPNRSVCSYVARLGDVVVVTNSLHLLQRLAAVDRGEVQSIASLDEYVFFRSRYVLGGNDVEASPAAAPQETAFLFLSDATIRRWCGPKWRIAASRRTRDAAVMADLQASQLDRLVDGGVRPGPIYTDLPIAQQGELQLTPEGVVSSALGTLDFMTPIAEVSMDRVTKAEAEAYERWRRGYQSNWQWAFDPIGLRMEIDKGRIGADLTVMPLIAGTEYRDLISISRGATFRPDAADLHDALGHLTLAINRDSQPMRSAASYAQMMAQGVGVEPLAWLGNHVSVYLDDDPIWDELAEVEPDERNKFLEQNFWRLPVAFRADVSSGLKLTVFLTAFRAFVDQTAPGMAAWESLTYKEQPYVKVTPTERARRETEEMEKLAIYYMASGESLLVTLSEPLLKRAIDRQLARNEAKGKGEEPPAPHRLWLGESVGLQAQRKLLDVVAALSRREYQEMMQRRAWSNLPVLNEWKRRYPDQDPAKLHARFWQTELICPGDGSYAWNDRWQTMESTVYGHPAEPKEGPAAPPLLGQLRHGNFGLSFEEQGLRARVMLER
ncbi:MAG: hypothetical protein RBS80_11865 [Thermoguttaceae bacterium]|nr:hypothetical protein [Thermoguttaceae bacterium]